MQHNVFSTVKTPHALEFYVIYFSKCFSLEKNIKLIFFYNFNVLMSKIKKSKKNHFDVFSIEEFLFCKNTMRCEPGG